VTTSSTVSVTSLARSFAATVGSFAALVYALDQNPAALRLDVALNYYRQSGTT
jgi:hypothetical protein